MIQNDAIVRGINMGMKKIDYKKMEQELKKADPESISGDGYEVNEKTMPIMLKFGFIQEDEERQAAARFNGQLIERFLKYLKGNDLSISAYDDLSWYNEMNEDSACTLRFTDVDEEHFNYLLFNRCIRKVAGMGKTDYLRVLKSLGYFSGFLKQERLKNAGLFQKISRQQKKMIGRLDDYDRVQDSSGSMSDEEYADEMFKIFGYHYLE